MKGAHDKRQPATCKQFCFSKQTSLKNEIRLITNKGKTAKVEWKNNESDFLWALCGVYEKLGQFSFQTYLLTCLKKDTSGLSKVINNWS